MRIGILAPIPAEDGKNQVYNSQEIGLGKALNDISNDIIIYKLFKKNVIHTHEVIHDYEQINYKKISCRQLGASGLISTSELTKELDLMICFADTQLIVPRIYKWSKKNNIIFIPYIGVIESHSRNKIKKFFLDVLFKRNLEVYKKCHCLAKTPYVENKLRLKGVNNISVAPVGLDLTLLKSNYHTHDISSLKLKYGYNNGEKVLLFIGRLIDEKQPFRMIELFEKIYKSDNSYRLLMVGKGELQNTVKNRIDNKHLTRVVNLVEQIPNKDIWELYRISEAFINLNQQEIFGMAILEAMYYECKVVALHAPGPDFIIEDGVSGYLVTSDEEILYAIQNGILDTDSIHNRIVRNFIWERTAQIIDEELKNE